METLEALTLEEEKIKLNHENLEELENEIRGDIITPESEGYDEARTIYNAMIDKSPALIVKCSNVADRSNREDDEMVPRLVAQCPRRCVCLFPDGGGAR